MLPNAFPKEAAKIFVGLALGQPLPETLVLVTAGYELLGYGLYVAFDGSNPLVGDDEEAAQLKSQLADTAVQEKIKAALPPFIINLFMLAIQKLLERLAKPKV